MRSMYDFSISYDFDSTDFCRHSLISKFNELSLEYKAAILVWVRQ
jgi:hypothetical protein